MKLKSFITVSLALGMIATTGATVAGNEGICSRKEQDLQLRKLKKCKMFHIQLQ